MGEQSKGGESMGEESSFKTTSDSPHGSVLIRFMSLCSVHFSFSKAHKLRVFPSEPQTGPPLSMHGSSHAHFATPATTLHVAPKWHFTVLQLPKNIRWTNFYIVRQSDNRFGGKLMLLFSRKRVNLT